MQTKRKLSEYQRCFYLDGNVSFNVCFGVRVNRVFTDDALAAALLKIQEKHYLLNAFIEKEGNTGHQFVIGGLVPPIPVRKAVWKSEDT